MNECPRCGRTESHTEICALQGEIERLRRELSEEKIYVLYLDKVYQASENAITTLRAELAELRKPDCFRCAYWFACRTLIKDDCGGGDKFVPKRDPVRLYEIDAAMAGGEHG